MYSPDYCNKVEIYILSHVLTFKTIVLKVFSTSLESPPPEGVDKGLTSQQKRLC